MLSTHSSARPLSQRLADRHCSSTFSWPASAAGVSKTLADIALSYCFDRARGVAVWLCLGVISARGVLLKTGALLFCFSCQQAMLLWRRAAACRF